MTTPREIAAKMIADAEGVEFCQPIVCPDVEEIEVSLIQLPYAEACWDINDDGECPKCANGFGDRFAWCPKRSVFA